MEHKVAEGYIIRLSVGKNLFVTYLNFTGLPIGLLINFGERSLHPRRVFPSSQTDEQRINHQWIFVPEWLQSQKHDDDASSSS